MITSSRFADKVDREATTALITALELQRVCDRVSRVMTDADPATDLGRAEAVTKGEE